MSLYGQRMSRKALADHLGQQGATLRKAIRELKQQGRLVQLRVSAGPITSKKKDTFVLLPQTLDLPLPEAK